MVNFNVILYMSNDIMIKKNEKLGQVMNIFNENLNSINKILVNGCKTFHQPPFPSIPCLYYITSFTGFIYIYEKFS